MKKLILATACSVLILASLVLVLQPQTDCERFDCISRLTISDSEVVEGTIRAIAHPRNSHGDAVYIVNTREGKCLAILQQDVLVKELTQEVLPGTPRSCSDDELEFFVPQARL